jgi:mersacidin/lichenicidin family type 2 lantibiotic
MSLRKTVRAWEDPEYRNSLSAAELADLPENPAGIIELTDAELGQVLGGAQSGNSVGCNTKTCVTSRGNSRNPCGANC